MPTVAEVVDAVIGGDTHVDTTSLCLCSPAGAVLGELTFDNDVQGFEEAVSWVLSSVPSQRFMVGLEGTSSYGAGLCRALQAQNLTVVEIERPSRGERGRRGKSDAGDAKLAAHKLLATDAELVAQPRTTGDGPRESLRILTIDREQLAVQCTRVTNRLLAMLLTGDAADHQLRRKGLTVQHLHQIAGRRGPRNETEDQAIRRLMLRRLAKEILELNVLLRDNEKQLRSIVKAIAPQLLARFGVGPVTAAQLIVSYSHHGRCRDEAAFASLAGVAPVPASSGRVVRHRLNRGGDRRLNRAFHYIVMTRMRSQERTRAFVQARKNGKSDRELRRILKRYIAREMFKILQTIDALKPVPIAA
jgi:transposase